MSKAIDKAAGADRKVVGEGPNAARRPNPIRTGSAFSDDACVWGQGDPITVPATPDAERWSGFGTALKPSHEPIVVARKPLQGTVAANCLQHGTGALNVDGCRVGTSERPVMVRTTTTVAANAMSGESTGATSSGETTNLGRFPSNLVLSHSEGCRPVGTRRVKSGNSTLGVEHGTDSGVTYLPQKESGRHYADPDGTEEVSAWECVPGCPVRALDEQAGERRSAGEYVKGNGTQGDKTGAASIPIDGLTSATYGDSGGASRFFPTFDARHEDAERRFLYAAKASSAERNAGLDGFEKRASAPYNERPSGQLNAHLHGADPPPRQNTHPTVKPIALARWLVRLVGCQPGSTILDPFLGSGTTGIAARLEGFNFIGIEQDAEYARIAEARIAWWSRHPDGMALVKRLEAERERAEIAEAGQGALFS